MPFRSKETCALPICEQRIAERIQFLLRRLLDFERVLKHAGGSVSGGGRGVVRKECPLDQKRRVLFRSVNSGSPSASNSFCADCLISREYLSTRAGAFQAAGAVLFVRNALFLSARFRNQPVREVLPDGPVCFQID